MKLKPITPYVTDYEHSKFLYRESPINFCEDLPGNAGRESELLCVDDDIQFQEILGFGGAITQASASILCGLSFQKRENILREYFDPVEGIGYTFCRSTINSCDFSEKPYSYDDTPDDFSLKNFDISRDKKDVLPIILRAQELSAELVFFSSPWSPPAWMKTNNDMCHGGSLKAGYEQVWAEYLAKFVRAYRKEGVRLWGITLQNEENGKMGWESCFYDKDQMTAFISDYVRTVFDAEDISDTHIFYWDHNKDRIVDHAKAVFMDKSARDTISGTAFHWYVSDHFGALDAVHQLMPDKYLLATEGCLGYRKASVYDSGEKYAHDIIGDINHWANSWTDWNIVLNSDGGPDHWREEQKQFVKQYKKRKAIGEKFTDAEKEFLFRYIDEPIWKGEAPVIVDEQENEWKLSSFYYIGHFSKFVRPGARRIACSIYGVDLECSAFKNQDGSIVVVVLNKTDNDHIIFLRYHEQLAEYKIKRHSIQTYIF